MNHFRLYKVRDFGDMISDAFEFIKLMFRPILQGYLTVILPLVLVCSVFISVYLKGFMETIQQGTQGIDSKEKVLGMFYDIFFSPFLYLSFLLPIILSIVSMVFILGVFKQVELHGLSIDIKDVYRTIRAKSVSIFFASVASGILIMIGSLFCLFPGIALAIFWSLMSAVIILEDCSLSDSFSRSYQLVKDNWWKTFILLTVMTFMVWILSSVVTYPLTFLLLDGPSIFSMNPETSMTFYAETASWRLALYNAITMSWQYFITLLSTVLIGILFYSYKEEKEHVSIKNDLDNLGA